MEVDEKRKNGEEEEEKNRRMRTRWEKKRGG